MSFADFLKQEEEKKPGFFDSPTLKKVGSGIWNFAKSPVKSTAKFAANTASGFGNWLQNTEVGKRSAKRAQDAQGFGGQTAAFGKNVADLGFTIGKTAIQETAAGAVSLIKSANQLSGIKQDPRLALLTPEQQAESEKNLFGREVESVQDAYVNPTLNYADKSGSGTFEKFVLGSGAAIGGLVLESPIGTPVKTPVKMMVKEWVKNGAKRAEIEAGVQTLNLNPDKAGELVDSLEQIVGGKFKQGEKVSRSNRLIDFVLEQEKKTPVSQPKNSVLQVRDMKTGEDVFYKVSPEDLRILSEDLIDGTKKGVAGKQIGDKIYHLTAKTPKEMLDTAGWSYGGQKELSEVMEMIKPPSRRVTLRTEDGRFAGSFMDDGASYKLAAQEISAERALAEQVKRFTDANSFVDEVASIADRMAKYGNDPKVLRSQVSRLEEKLYKSIEKYSALPRIKQMLNDGKTGEEILQRFYGDVTGPNYRNQSIFERSFNKTFEEVTNTLEDIFGRVIPIAELSPNMTRGGSQLLGKTDGTVISLLRRAGGLNQAIANHEGWHWFKRNLSDSKVAELNALEKEYFKRISPAELDNLKNTYKQGRMSDASYEKILREEYMADEFARYYETGRTTWQKVADFFDKALRGLKTIFKYEEDITKTVSREFRNVRGTLENNPGKAKAGTPSADKKIRTEGYEQAEMEMLASMEYIEAGIKQTENGYARFSSFPKWIPEQFRQSRIIKPVMEHVKNGTEPKANAIQQIEFKKLVDEEIDRMAELYKTDEDAMTEWASEFNALPTGNDIGQIPDSTGSIQKTPESQTGQQASEGLTKASTLPTVYTAENKKAVIKTADNLNEPVKETVKRFAGIRRIKANILEYVQNSDERIRLLMEKPGLKIGDDNNVYQKATLYSGKVGALVDEARAETKTVVDMVKDASKYRGIKYDTVKKEVNEYLVALHAPERNAIHGENAAGMTDAEARLIVERTNNSPYATEIKKIAGEIKRMNEKTLDILKDSGVLSEEQYAGLRETYKNHVPLYRVIEGEEDFGSALTGKGFDVRGTGIKRAKGSDMEIDDILGNVAFNYEQAILRSQKNAVDLATLKFTRDNKEALKGIMEESSPKMIGKDFNDLPLLEKTDDPRILQLREKGKPVWIKVKDPKLAIAIRGVGREKLGVILNAVGSFTRLYSGLATRFNPDFALPNKIRDLQETMVYLSSQKDVGAKGALKTLRRDPASTKHILDALRGKDTEGARLYKEMRDAGGTTGGMGLSTRKETGISIEKLEKLANSKTRKLADNIVEYVDNWNTIFEDSTRLSVYKAAREQGLSIDRSAFLAKEASINFNRMGTGGPLINSLWMFSNASIQGSTKMVRSLRDPKVAAGVATIIGVAVASTGEWNDQADADWRSKVPKWDRMNSLIVVLPSTDDEFHYMAVPVSWGVKPIKVMADYAYDATSGHVNSAKDITEGILTSILEGYNPVGGTDITSSLMPTILDTPYEISRNKSWSGSSLTPTNYNNSPDDALFFNSLPDTATGRTAISITDAMAKGGIEVSPARLKYAYEQYVGGAGRFVSKVINAVSGAVGPEPTPLDEYPFIGRFYKERTEEEQGYTNSTTRESELFSDLSKDDARMRKQTSLAVDNAVSDIEALATPDEKKTYLKKLADTNPELVKKVIDEIKDNALGLTGEEKRLKEATVAVRAQFIQAELDRLTTTEEKKVYLKEMADKNIVTSAVLKELNK